MSSVALKKLEAIASELRAVVPEARQQQNVPEARQQQNVPEARQQQNEPEAYQPRIAVLLPCLNEAAAIGRVVAAFKASLPTAVIYVYDNNSTDNTSDVARAAGAVVRQERLRGKGNVVRRMFADIDADIYVLADGDLTYDSSRVGDLVEAVRRQDLDMIVAARDGGGDKAYRRGHQLGNRAFNQLVAKLFGDGFSDIFSGYRAFSRRFVKSFPASASGFETEAELSIHALDLRLSTHEISLPYGSRPEDSKSKLRTYRDGARILWTISRMYYALHPLRVLGSLSGCLTVLSLIIGAPVVLDYFSTGLVPRFPSAILAAALMQMSWLALACGTILQAISGTRREMKRMRYLDLPSVR